jgi:hypothetical protein
MGYLADVPRPICRKILIGCCAGIWIDPVLGEGTQATTTRSQSMIRNLKVMLAAALALTALGAIAASAHAADEFHCSVEPCRLNAGPDGTGKTTHQVFIVKNAAETESVSFTCEKLTGVGTNATKTATEVKLPLTNTSYANCTVNGSPGVVVDAAGCEYVFHSAGGTTDQAGVDVVCSGTNKIQVTVPGGCTFTIGNQSLTGIGYHTINESPNREVTVTSNVSGIATTANATCAALINPNQTLTGFYTTGNAIVTGAVDSTGAMAEAWYE